MKLLLAVAVTAPWYGYVIYSNENSLYKIGLNINIDGKRPKRECRECIEIRRMAKQNPATDQKQPIPLLNGTKAEEEDADFCCNLERKTAIRCDKWGSRIVLTEK